MTAPMKLGARLESFGRPFRAALLEAAKLGVAGVQFDALGELSPKVLTDTGRREIRHLLRSHGLELTALACPLRHGFDRLENLDARMERVTQTLTLSADLGARRVVVEAGPVPIDATADAARRMTESLRSLGHHGDRIGAVLALESGLESGEALAAYLTTFTDTGGLAVNYDPANMLLHGFDPVANLLPLRGRIVHTHARDARISGASRSAVEVPVGAGDVDWMAYLGTLASLEYGGWVVVELSGNDDRMADIAAGVRFLRRLA